MKKSNRELFYEIRDLGYRPNIKHFRKVIQTEEIKMYFETDELDLNEIRENKFQEFIIAKGGHTVCLFIDDDGNWLKDSDGDLVCVRAHCNPKDNYNKKIGVQIALARGIEYLKAPHQAVMFGSL